jgi:hypothetical protein
MPGGFFFWLGGCEAKFEQSADVPLVAPGRVELPTFGLGNRCSIHLSYGAGGSMMIISRSD